MNACLCSAHKRKASSNIGCSLLAPTHILVHMLTNTYVCMFVTASAFANFNKNIKEVSELCAPSVAYFGKYKQDVHMYSV